MTLQRIGTYKGPMPFLKGKRATVFPGLADRCLAQFEDIATGYSSGWHDFSLDSFELDPIDGEDLA